ncbi:2'-5' RNA ligase family protein [Microbacterium sp. A84]|uniref:2'-5' RNA ligase family protein n=1 Tax=Microbacterium sp. A84 TaxID=3450715 RepID=UPI003F435C51
MSRTALIIGWFGQEALWLAPESPTPFIELTSAVTRAFPVYPPYGGLHDASVPHATVGDSAGYEELQDAERVVGAELPLSGTASAVVLLVEGPHGRWREASRFPLS